MPIGKRANGSWRISFYREDGSRFEKTLPAVLTKREVETMEARYRLQERARPAREHRGPTLADLFVRYWHERGQHIASAASEKGYLDAWYARLGEDTDLADITSDQISAAVAFWRSTPEIPRGRKHPALAGPSTINHRIGCLQRAWRRASRVWGWRLAAIEWSEMKLDEPEPVHRDSPYQMLLAYFAALPPRSRWPSLWSFNSGLRRGGVLRITKADIDFEGRVVHTVSKGRAGGKPTPVPLTDALLAVLTAMGPLPEVGRIFPVTIHELRKDRQRARKLVGLRSLRFIDHRHDFAQGLEDRGLGDMITDALHHSDPKLRRRYSRVKLHRMRARMDGVPPNAPKPGAT